MTLPAVRERPPTVLPRVEVTNLAPPVAPVSEEEEDVIGILVCLDFGKRSLICLDVCIEVVVVVVVVVEGMEVVRGYIDGLLI